MLALAISPRHNPGMTALTSIHTYPIKSCAGLRHSSIAVEPRGLAGDRRWLIVDPAGRFITGRQHPSLVRVRIEPTADGLLLNAPGMPRLNVATPPRSDAAAKIRIWRDDTTARQADKSAAEWLSTYLGTRCRLVYQHDDDLRTIADQQGGRSGDHVSFADAYPLLLIGSASLADLNRRLPAPVVMERFRTNLVAATDEPFVEDGWRTAEIGGVTFDVAKRCSRCVFTTVDPISGTKNADGEPFKTLRSYRLSKEERGVLFGVNLIPRKTGVIRNGQTIETN